MKLGALLKWGKGVIKMGDFNKRSWVERVAQEVCAETFL
jgi:hypothetical protein